jgi:GNAT superfamily N-acetyltransferase
MVSFVKGLEPGDDIIIREILLSSGFFYDFEIDIAVWMAEETISHGMEETGFFWMKAIDEGKMIGFANYEKDPMSVHSWELNWIAVHEDHRNKKSGGALLKAVEQDVHNSGGRILWAETSGRPLYAPTEKFYNNNGYDLSASLRDYYGPGDPKQVYSKVLSSN